MVASPLSMVLKGGWPNVDCVHLCTKAVKQVEGRNTYAQRTREASTVFRDTVCSAGQLMVIAFQY